MVSLPNEMRTRLCNKLANCKLLSSSISEEQMLLRFNGKIRQAFFEAFREQNPAAFRVELLLEDAAETERIVRGYQRLLAGGISGPALIRELNLRSQLGVTTGTLAAT